MIITTIIITIIIIIIIIIQYNTIASIQATSQKYLGIILDSQLSFEKNLETALYKINKTIGLIRKM